MKQTAQTKQVTLQTLSRWWDVAYYALFALSCTVSFVWMNSVAASKALYLSDWRIPVLLLAGLSGFVIGGIGYVIIAGLMRRKVGLPFLPSD